MRELRLAYFAHTVRSDWNNGNAHFLRGLLKALTRLGHEVRVYEPATEWSYDNLLLEERGRESQAGFEAAYGEIRPELYGVDEADEIWAERLRGVDVVVLHEWNPPALARLLLRLKERAGFRLVFHDTHHRASSSPESFAELGLASFDGVLAFGEALRRIYRERFGVTRVWTLHEAADTEVFRPLGASETEQDLVWVGNWGEGERAREIGEFLIEPAAALKVRTKVFGVRYPQTGLDALQAAGIAYGGYLPNLAAPAVYARSRLTVHVPRQQYSAVMTGIPTIRVFEALACGIPLISAPWRDTEGLFREGDFQFVADGAEMQAQMKRLLEDPAAAEDQAARGLETVLARHTCGHRAREVTAIFEELVK